MKKVVDIPELIDLNSLIVNTNFFFFPNTIGGGKPSEYGKVSNGLDISHFE